MGASAPACTRGSCRAVELRLVKAGLKAKHSLAELFMADHGCMGASVGAKQVAIVEVGKYYYVREFLLEPVKDWVKGGGKEPRAVWVTLTDALSGGDWGGGVWRDDGAAASV